MARRALAAVEAIRPDTVFLDIQMPGASGFDFLERTVGNFRTVFVTAYDTFAIRAFEVNAIDYLLKPVDPVRLDQTIARLRSSTGAAQKNTPGPKTRFEYADHLFVRTNTKARFVPVKSIQAIVAAGAYSEILTSTGEGWFVLRSIKEWTNRLPVSRFVRIHRSTIVNVEFVDRIERRSNYSARVFVAGRPKPFVMSRRFCAMLKTKFN